MERYSEQNKKAWEFNAYEFWVQDAGQPKDRAQAILKNPLGALKKYAAYFDAFEGVKIANICGSCGKKAVPLAVLGAEVTVFDISEENKRYAMELADAAGVHIEYDVCDVMELDLATFENCFDVVFMEGGILHYFHDIDEFMKKMCAILKPGGKMICSDFHPFTKMVDTLDLKQPVMSYFSTEVYEAEMAHARFFEDDVRAQMPKCSCRKYNLSEIINAVVGNGFVLKRFDEHSSWVDDKVPGEFTIIAEKAK